MPLFTQLTSTTYLLLVDNIDTDQIIPARFLKATDKTGMGEALFADWRYNADGSLKTDFPLNRPERQGSQVLIAGDNFGCGSSREHAPWALTGFGFRAVISTSFADIFRNNALKNGLLPIQVENETFQALIEQASSEPQAKVTIDLQEDTLTLPDGSQISFQIDPFSKTCLLNGVDELGYLLTYSDRISEFEQKRLRNPCFEFKE
jgi:3-isopropylmalate/(R)-2-methylmalate dehydratase small subunit